MIGKLKDCNFKEPTTQIQGNNFENAQIYKEKSFQIEIDEN